MSLNTDHLLKTANTLEQAIIKRSEVLATDGVLYDLSYTPWRGRRRTFLMPYH